ncbi:hypothetical protein [Halodesulfovibrio aestuarii]|uniref:hypothetical protein n=1 Tax=Halodesulfovibrio aestuarii TaxID=126333 RepID=UPI003D34EF1C
MDAREWVELNGSDADVLPEEGQCVEISVQYYTADNKPVAEEVLSAVHTAGVFHVSKSDAGNYPFHRTCAWRSIVKEGGE